MQKEIKVISIGGIPSDLFTLAPSYYDREKFQKYMDDMLATSVRQIPINHWIYFQEAKSVVSSFLSPSKYITHVGMIHSDGSGWNQGSEFFETNVREKCGPYSIDDWKRSLITEWPEETTRYIQELAKFAMGYVKPLLILEDVFAEIFEAFMSANYSTNKISLEVVPLILKGSA